MHFGVSMFHTDYSIPAVQLARALEARGFESMWAPEHSHIPVPRKTPFPGGGELPKPYYEVMDPFVVLSAAAVVTKTLKLATGVCLVVQRDPIQTAKLVASIDQVSNGRFLFGVGGAFPHAARRAVRYGDGWVPIAGRAPYGDVNDYLPKFKEMVSEAGRDPAGLPITLFGGTEDVDLLKRYRDMGVARVVTTLPPEPADRTLPVLDRWGELIRRVNA